MAFFFQAEDGIRDSSVTGVQTCAFLFSSRRRHTRFKCDWSSDVCSSDLTAAQVRSFGGYVELISQNNSGPGAASTHGMTLVETRFMAFIDADDLWMQKDRKSVV